MRDHGRWPGSRRYSLCSVFILITFARAFGESGALQSRPATVDDSIEMTVVGEPLDGYFGNPPAILSPDGSRFVVVLRRGDIQTNTNAYRLLLFRSADAFGSAEADVLLTMRSASNCPGIRSPQWLKDNTSLLFLGCASNDQQQLFLLNTKSRAVTRLSNHPTDIVAFAATELLDTIVYIARPPLVKHGDSSGDGVSIVVSDQFLAHLLMGQSSEFSDDFLFAPNPYQVFVVHSGGDPVRIDMGLNKPQPGTDLSVSPAGTFAIVKNFAGSWPELWKEYNDDYVRGAIFRGAGELYQFFLVNTRTGSVEPLIDAPSAAMKPSVLWLDGESVIIVDTLLPLSVPGQDQERRSHRFVAEVNVKTGRIHPIARGDYELVTWDPGPRKLTLRPKYQETIESARHGVRLIRFCRGSEAWSECPSRHTRADVHDRQFDVLLHESPNDSPRLVARHRGSGKTRVLLDLNPQFASVKFGRVEEIFWKTRDGYPAKGGLYFPANYKAGSRYPLVIQTHGWNSQKFWIDGPSTAGYAAQALAGRGFFVAQVEDNDYEVAETPLEGARAMAVYEGLIDNLDRRGFVNRGEVGILGWSRTGFHVRYALTFSSYHFAAAAIVDGMDVSYFEYLTWLNFGRNASWDQMIGAAPFGEGLRQWIKDATGFNLDRVCTPVRLVGLQPYSLLSNWEWFVGPRHLSKPVEFVWLPRAAHSPIRPSERLLVQQGNVDWFSFWLKAEENLDSAHRGQYERWRTLRERREARCVDDPSPLIRE